MLRHATTLNDGINLFTDHPVRVGNFFRFGDRIGTVQEIWLRSN